MRFFRIQYDFFCRSVFFFACLSFVSQVVVFKTCFWFPTREGFPLCWRFVSLVKAMGFSGFPNLERSIFETNQPRALGVFGECREVPDIAHPFGNPLFANYESGIHKKSLLVKVFFGCFAKVSTHINIYIFFVYEYIYILYI